MRRANFKQLCWTSSLLLLLLNSSQALACWTCGDLVPLNEVMEEFKVILQVLDGNASGSNGSLNFNLGEIKSALQPITNNSADATQVATVTKEQNSKNALATERAANVKAAALNYAPTVQGCLSATAAAGMVKSGAAAQNAKASYQASAASALIRAPRPASSDMQSVLTQSAPFCTAQQIADETAAGIPAAQRQCPATPVVGGLPAASILAGSLFGGMIDPAASPGGSAGEVSRKANDSIGSTVGVAPNPSSANGNISPAMAVNQVHAADVFIANVQGPALPTPYDPQAIDTPDGKARKTNWDAFSARMSTVPEALSSIGGLRTVNMTANSQGVLSPPVGDPIWAKNQPIWQSLFPAESFPDTPSEWERIKFEVYRQQSGAGLPNHEQDLATLKALQLQLSLMQLRRTEESNAVTAAMVAQSLYPITKQDLDGLAQNVAQGRYTTFSVQPAP